MLVKPKKESWYKQKVTRNRKLVQTKILFKKSDI